MTKAERLLKNEYKKESNQVLFEGVDFNDSLKRKIVAGKDVSRREATAERRSFFGRRGKTTYGVAAAAMLFVAVLSFPLLGDLTGTKGGNALNPPIASVAPTDSGTTSPGTVEPPAGSGISGLTYVTLQTPEEAKLRFEGTLLVPAYVPEGYAVRGIEGSGMAADVSSRIVFFYQGTGAEYTYTADLAPAFVPLEMFEEIAVNGGTGHIFVQPGMTELYWVADGVQYAITGPLTAEEALAIAASLE